MMLRGVLARVRVNVSRLSRLQGSRAKFTRRLPDIHRATSHFLSFPLVFSHSHQRLRSALRGGVLAWKYKRVTRLIQYNRMPSKASRKAIALFVRSEER